MDSLLSVFLMFLVAIMGLLTFLIVPHMPVMTLVTVCSVLLAVGIWWHWSQFSTEYRTSTWQAKLRDYASYVIVAVVILAVYVFYAYGWTGSSLQAYIRTTTANAISSAQNAARRASARTQRSIASATNALIGEAGPVNAGMAAGSPAMNMAL